MPGGRILVVDDDLTVRDTLGRVLEEEGYRVEYSANGADALDKVPGFEPHVIVLDLMMPGMNGRQFLATLRQDLGITHIPVLVITAINGLTLQQASAMGITDVVEKPFDLDDVLNKIALALYRVTGPIQVRDEPATGARGHSPPPQHESDAVVLVVDSDRDMLRRFDQLLSPLGYQVVSMARVTDELLRLARVLEPRAILLDLHLPGTDGLAALRQLRAEPALDPVPILIFAKDAAALALVRAEIDTLAAAALLEPLGDSELIGFLSSPPRAARRDAGVV